jgi:PAS domain S-box-containing protein
VRFEFQTTRAGERKWFTGCVFPVRSQKLDRSKFAYLVENITPSKENEISLIEARERLAAALESGALATWDWDIQRDVVYGDSVLVDLYGVPAEYVRGAPAHKFLEHIHPEDRERVRKQINLALEKGEKYTEQYRTVGRDGQIRWVSATGRVIHDSAGKPARFPGVAVEITHLKEVEDALQRATTASRNQLRELESVYTYAPVGLGVIDSERRWLRVNKVMAEYFGRPASDFIGKPVHEVLPTIADGFERHLSDSMQSKTPVLNVEVSGECPIRQGSIRTWSTNFYPLLNGHERLVGISVVTEDVTEDRRAIEEHRAHRTILDMVTLQEPLEAVLSVLTDAVEGIFPGAKSYILSNHDGPESLAPLSQLHRSVAQSIFIPALSAEDLAVVRELMERREELLIPDLSVRNDKGFLARVHQAGMLSCWIKPIVLSDGSVWGACAIHHPTIRQNPTQGERDHLEVLVRLAATVIERRAFLEQLTTTSERLQYAERAGRIGVFDWSPQTGRLVWTPQLEESFGLAPGSFEGTFEGWRKRVHPDDIGAVTDHLARLMASQSVHFNHEYRIIMPTGEVRWTSDQGEFSYNEAGQAVRMVGVAIDSTARKRLEEQGRRDQERLQLALEGGNLGFWDWNIETGAVQFGGTWAAMVGYSPEEIEPHVRAREALVHPDDKAEVQRRLSQHLAGETEIYEVEHRLKTKSGKWVWILDRGRVVERAADGKPLRAVGIHADIHEQRMIREKLNSEAKKKDEFIATLAHELRNPLAPLRTGLEILRRDPTGQPAVKAREMMNRQLSHMVRLIEDLLDISRISLGKLELRIEQITLESVIESALEHSRPAIDAAHHELSVKLPKEEVLLPGDIARLSQVVANLLVNAAKYTLPGGKISVVTAVDDGHITIKVSDSGIGIPADKLSDIFEMFSQVYSPLDRTQGGLGIGLALVRRLVQMHRGEVYAESPGPGLGSTFTVRLPRVVKDTMPEQEPKEMGSQAIIM